MLDDLPPYEADDPSFQNLVNCFAKEIDRIEDVANDIRTKLFPQNADDTYMTLSMWEKLLGLTVSPTGVSIEDRRAAVLSNIRKRNAGSGASWVDLMTTAIGTLAWSHSEGPGDNQITISAPYSSGTYNAGNSAVLARRITPAHLEILATYDEGFIIGVSMIGDLL